MWYQHMQNITAHVESTHRIELHKLNQHMQKIMAHVEFESTHRIELYMGNQHTE